MSCHTCGLQAILDSVASGHVGSCDVPDSVSTNQRPSWNLKLFSKQEIPPRATTTLSDPLGEVSHATPWVR